MVKNFCTIFLLKKSWSLSTQKYEHTSAARKKAFCYDQDGITYLKQILDERNETTDLRLKDTRKHRAVFPERKES